MSLSANDKKELKREAYSITTREEQRMAIQLSKDGSAIEENQRSFYDVNAAQQENLKISEMLQNADELRLSDGQVRIRLHRIRRKLRKGMSFDA